MTLPQAAAIALVLFWLGAITASIRNVEQAINNASAACQAAP